MLYDQCALAGRHTLQAVYETLDVRKPLQAILELEVNCRKWYVLLNILKKVLIWTNTHWIFRRLHSGEYRYPESVHYFKQLAKSISQVTVSDLATFLSSVWAVFRHKWRRCVFLSCSSACFIYLFLQHHIIAYVLCLDGCFDWARSCCSSNRGWGYATDFPPSSKAAANRLGRRLLFDWGQWMYPSMSSRFFSKLFVYDGT